MEPGKYYTLFSAGIPIGVVDRATKYMWWFDKLPAESRKEGMELPRFDINRGAFVPETRLTDNRFLLSP
jgi:hypothetical protein